ncbi:MAG: hypothetical protein DRQ88_06085 [Epsilonproteobacteria bacterium]|nr:MAG: hypothetical protein DRQ88_06085 [Campylobacterota bacterium]
MESLNRDLYFEVRDSIKLFIKERDIFTFMELKDLFQERVNEDNLSRILTKLLIERKSLWGNLRFNNKKYYIKKVEGRTKEMIIKKLKTIGGNE